MIEWLRSNPVLLGWLAALSVLTFVGTLTVVPLLVMRIPHDYFARERRRRNAWDGFNPVLRLAQDEWSSGKGRPPRPSRWAADACDKPLRGSASW